MYSRIQDAAMYKKLKAAADMVGGGRGSSVEMKGYKKVTTEEAEVEEEEAVQEVEYWTTVEVCSFLRKRLLEYEGADVESVNELLKMFAEREVKTCVHSAFS